MKLNTLDSSLVGHIAKLDTSKADMRIVNGLEALFQNQTGKIEEPKTSDIFGNASINHHKIKLL